MLALKSYFKLKSLEIENWGPFEGKFKIDFSVDDKKNVTYVLGNNGAGKSFLFQAIKWLLFKEEKFIHVDVSGSVDMLNSSIKEDGATDLFFRVKISFDSFMKGKKYIYDIERKCEFHYFQTEDKWKFKKEYFEAYRDDSISVRKLLNESQYLADINQYFPMGPKNFFFLDGEKMAENFRSKNMRNVKEFTVSLSDIPDIEEELNSFENYKKDLENRYNRHLKRKKSSNTRETNIKKKIADFNEIISKNQEYLKNDIGELEIIEDKIIDCDEYLQDGLSRLPQLNSELNDIRIEIKSQVNDIFNKNNELADYLRHNSSFILLKNNMEQCLEDIKYKKENGILPQILDKTLIDEFLKKEYCICGNLITDEIRSKFIKLRNEIPERDETLEIDNFEKALRRKLNKISNWKKILLTHSKEIAVFQDDLRQNQGKKERLEREISNSCEDPEKYLEYFKSQREYSTKKGELIERIDKLKQKIANAEINKEKSEKDLDKLLERHETHDPKGNAIKRKIKLTTLAIEKIIWIVSELNKSITENLENQTFKNWKKLIEDPNTWEKIIIENHGSSWKINPIKKFMDETTSLSQGQRHILGISFLTSQASLFGNSYPLVFDSPFGRLSQIPIQNLGENLPNLLNGSQIIIFVTDTESNNIYKNIEKSIGKYYELNKIEKENRTVIIEKKIGF